LTILIIFDSEYQYHLGQNQLAIFRVRRLRKCIDILTNLIQSKMQFFSGLSIILLIWRMGIFTLHYHSPDSLELIL